MDLKIFNPILDGVRDTPILDGGKKAPKFNSAIWRLTTIKLGGNRVEAKNFSTQQKLVTS